LSPLSAILPSQSRFSRHWHLYLYRFGLPVVALGYLIHAMAATNQMDQLNAAVCALVCLIALAMSYMLSDRHVFVIDIMLGLVLWGSLVNGIAQINLHQPADGLPILTMCLIWAPAVALYWGMVFHERWLFGMLLTMLYYAALLFADSFVLQRTGKNLLPYAWHLMLAQGAILASMMAVFSNIAVQLKISEARWRKAEHRANHDQLTGLLNKRTFARHLPRVVKTSDEGKLDLSLMLIDFDHFKLINDRYGHSAGDNILRQVAKLFSADLRAGDALYRWGGEEFVIILRDTDADTLSVIAERLRRKTEQHVFGLKRPVTISVGLATYEAGETHENFFKRADAAMLCAKRNGRNRVETAHSAVKQAAPETEERANGTDG